MIENGPRSRNKGRGAQRVGQRVSASDGAVRSVLVVDDERDMSEMIAFCLRQRGFDVTPVNDGEAAVELAKARPFDLAFCDLKMPRWDGVTTTRALKQAAPGLAVIIVTGFATDDMVEACMRSGAEHCLKKPFTVDELDIVVRDVLSASDARKERAR